MSKTEAFMDFSIVRRSNTGKYQEKTKPNKKTFQTIIRMKSN
jgi:hypothetical protein